MRRLEIDGIRGWAAICILFFHLIWETFGLVVDGYRSPTLSVLLDGPLAVFIFFVLSGDALSSQYTQSARVTISARQVLKRYFRLTGPILFSSLVLYLLMRFGLTFNQTAATIVKREDWFGLFIRLTPDLFAMLDFSTNIVYVNHTLQNSYNPFLWPMSFELIGSFFVFFLGFVYNKIRPREFLAFMIAFYLFEKGSLYSLFFIGICLGAIRNLGVFELLQRHLVLNRIVTLFAMGALFLIDKQPELYGFQSL
jgi:peptidoglycan/LPS O-acetylase OafA/YrhL